MKDVGNQWNWSHATTFSGYETRGRSRRTGPGGCNLALGWLTRQNFKFLPFLFAFSQTLHAPASSRYYQLHAQSAQLGFRYQWTVDPVQRIAKAKVYVLRKGLVLFLFGITQERKAQWNNFFWNVTLRKNPQLHTREPQFSERYTPVPKQAPLEEWHPANFNTFFIVSINVGNAQRATRDFNFSLLRRRVCTDY